MTDGDWERRRGARRAECGTSRGARPTSHFLPPVSMRRHTCCISGHAWVEAGVFAGARHIACAANAAVDGPSPIRVVILGRGLSAIERGRRVVRERRLLRRVAGHRIEQRLNEVLRCSQTVRVRETVLLHMASSIRVWKVVLFLGLVSANVQVQLARKSGVEESVVGENPRH